MSQANTTNPTELDDLLRGRIHLSGNGIGDGSVLQGKTVTRVVVSDGLSAEVVRNVATLRGSGTGVEFELGTYYYGVGAAGLNSVSGFTAGTPQRGLGYAAIVDATAQKFYTVYPSSWGDAVVTLDGLAVSMLTPRSITVSGVSCTLLESEGEATGTDLDFYVARASAGTSTGTALNVPAVSNVLVVNPCTLAGNPTRNGTWQLPFNTPAEAIAYALATAKVRPIIALAPGTYSGNLTIPEQLHGVDFVALVRSNDTNYPANLLGNVSLIAYSGSSRLGLHGVSLTGDVFCATAGAVPAQLTVIAKEATVSGAMSASAITIWAERSVITDGPITASSGAVSLHLDRYSRKFLIGGPTITPAPTIAVFDGPLTFAQGGDPGEPSTGGDVVASDAIQQIFNFPDGRRVWRYERMYCVVLENGVENSDIVITESEHGGDGAAVWNPGTDFSYPIAHVRVEFFGSLPNTLTSTTVSGFARMVWEGAIDKDGSSGVWAKREELSMVQPSWVAPNNLGNVRALMTLSGTANRNITIDLRYDGPQDPPPYSLVKVTIHGTGKFAL